MKRNLIVLLFAIILVNLTTLGAGCILKLHSHKIVGNIFMILGIATGVILFGYIAFLVFKVIKLDRENAKENKTNN